MTRLEQLGQKNRIEDLQHGTHDRIDRVFSGLKVGTDVTADVIGIPIHLVGRGTARLFRRILGR
jgi:hypothetical protein